MLLMRRYLSIPARNSCLVMYLKNNFNPDKEISVVLLGRPYIVLSKTLNKGIPDIFSSLGIKSFYQDMISSDDIDTEDISGFIKEGSLVFRNQNT